MGVELTLDRVTGVIRVLGEIDATSGSDFREGLCALVEPGGSVTLDLRDVAFMDSTGLKAIIELAKSRPAPVIVIGARNGVARLFEITRIDRVVPNLRIILNGWHAADEEIA